MLIDSDLVDAFADGRGTVFVGAGLSAGAGLVTWNELTQRLAAELDVRPDRFTPLEVAQLYRNRFGPAKLTELLLEMLRKLEARHTKAHEILVGGLHLDEIYTTNFDDLLEFACRECGRPPHTVYDSTTFGLFPREHFRIIKLHGDLNAPSSIVLASMDFESYMETHAALAVALDMQLRTKTVLFIGYGFRDPDIGSILQRVRRDSDGNGRPHFILALDPDEHAVSMFENRGLKVIRHDARGRLQEASLEWLSALESEVAKRRAARRPVREDAAALPQRAPEFVGRGDDCSAVLDALDRHHAVAICGSAGVGKTSVAAQVAETWQRRSHRARVIWFAARERWGRTRWLNEIADEIGVALGPSYSYIAKRAADEVDWKCDEIDRALRESASPTLFVLDNLETLPSEELEQVAQWAATLPPLGFVLMTSRPLSPRPAWLRELHVVDLQGLPERDALQLVERHLGSGAGEAERSRFHDLTVVTHRNPEAMKLAFGLILERACAVGELVERLSKTSGLDEVFDVLLRRAWNTLSSDAMLLMLGTTVFVGSIRRDIAGRVVGLSPQQAADAAQEAIGFKLLEPAREGKRYLVHPKVHEFARDLLAQDAELENSARSACAEEYLRIVKRVIEEGRTSPPVRYWRALVSDAMVELDPEWPMIREQMVWASGTGGAERDAGERADVLREYVMHLVHYMDSRCLNAERLTYARAVVDSPFTEQVPDDLALLRIDALAWTHLEEGDFAAAFAEIERGERTAERIADDRTRAELLAVAKAWKAVVYAREPRKDRGRALIAQALREAQGLEPWIRMRIQMAAGDIALTLGDAAQARHHYRDAMVSADKYGDDGLGYQLNPRLGLALVLLGEELHEAHRRFDAARTASVPSGKLYGDYGLGLLEFKRGRLERGRELIRKARERLAQRRASSLLRSLMDDLYERLAPVDFAADTDEAGAETEGTAALRNSAKRRGLKAAYKGRRKAD